MNNKHVAGVVIGLIIGVGGGFYGGMKYQQSQRPAFGGGQFAGLSGQGGNLGGARGAGARGGANTIFGTIIAKDANSITVQLGGPNATSTPSNPSGQANGNASGSKIVLYNNSTEVGKTVTGSTTDLSIGQMVVANGTANSDGSITATMIQLSPAGTPRAQ